MVQIFFIYADNCPHCNEALSTIESAIIQCKEISCKILKFSYDTKAAISIAINNEIDDLPGFVIGKEVFVKDDYTEERIVEAIKKAEKVK